LPHDRDVLQHRSGRTGPRRPQRASAWCWCR
jgi:hypothetical protein